MISLILLLGLLLSLPMLAQATLRYVGASATGAGTGVDGENLCGGLADADCTPVAGDTVYLCGAWTSTMTPQAVNGTAGNPITYDWDCPGNPATLIFDAGAQFAFLVNARTYWTVNNLRIQGKAGETGPTNQEALLFIGNGSNHIILNSPTVYDNSFKSGLYITNAHTISVNNLTAYNNTWYGAYVYTTTHHVVFDGFTTYNNARAGIQFLGLTTQATNAWNTAKNGTAYGNGDGLYAAIADHSTFQNNLVYSNTNVTGSGEGYGIGVQQVTNMLVSGNIIHDNRSDGIEVWGDATLSSNQCVVASNTIYNHLTSPTDMSGSNGIEERTGYAQGCKIYGNVLYHNYRHFRIGNDVSGTSVLAHNIAYGGLHGIRMVDSNEAGTNAVTGWTIMNNIFAGQTSRWLETDVASANSNTFATNDWVGTTGAIYNNVTYTEATITTVDATALTVDPLWVNATGVNFRTQGTSPLRRAGTPTSYCRDVRNRVCWTPPDIGAYQATSGDLAGPRAPRVTP